MKKTFTLSISGRLFNVEEDAYALLLNYLDSLSQVFQDPDGREIVDDIEYRIGEIFQAKCDEGKVVFTRADAEEVISIIGNAEQLTDAEENPERPGVPGGDYCDQRQDPLPNVPQPPMEVKRKLYRSASDRVLGGVLGGFAERFGINVLALRIITIVLCLTFGFFPFFIIYCVLWACIPLADTPERILEQEGRPINVTNIGEVLSRNRGVKPSDRGEVFLKTIGTLFMGFIGIISAFLGATLLIVLLVFIGIGIAAIWSTTAGMDALNNIGFDGTPNAIAAFISLISVCTAILIPCIALVWAACNVLFKARGATRTTWIIGIVIEIISIILAAVFIPLA